MTPPECGLSNRNMESPPTVRSMAMGVVSWGKTQESKPDVWGFVQMPPRHPRADAELSSWVCVQSEVWVAVAYLETE